MTKPLVVAIRIDQPVADQISVNCEAVWLMDPQTKEPCRSPAQILKALDLARTALLNAVPLDAPAVVTAAPAANGNRIKALAQRALRRR